jgi:hypothetical protein
MKKTLQFCVMMSTLIVACKKEGNSTVVKSTKELLTEKKWYLKAILITPALMGMSNQYDSLRPCDKDDIVSYRNNGKMEIDNGVLKCSVNGPQIDSSILWQLQDNKLITILDVGSQVIRDTFDVELIDAKYLNLGITFKYGKDKYKYLYKYENN